MPRPVQYNLSGENNLKLVKEGPEGLGGEGYFATKLDQVVGLARKKFNMAPAICNIMLRN